MKLNYRRTCFVGLAFLSICAFWQVYDNIIPLILKYTFHIDDTLTGAVMALDNILALFLLGVFAAAVALDQLRLRCWRPLSRRLFPPAGTGVGRSERKA